MKNFLIGALMAVLVFSLPNAAFAHHCGIGRGFGYSSRGFGGYSGFGGYGGFAAYSFALPVVAVQQYTVPLPTYAVPVLAAPVVQAPVVQTQEAPVVQTPVYGTPVAYASPVAPPVLLANIGSYSYGYGSGFGVGYGGFGNYGSFGHVRGFNSFTRRTPVIVRGNRVVRGPIVRVVNRRGPIVRVGVARGPIVRSSVVGVGRRGPAVIVRPGRR